MMGNKSFVFRFGDVEVREREFSLIKAGEALPVEPKAFRVLLILLRNPQKLITKEELLNSVWGDVAVGDNSLARSIALLRRLLGDDIRNPRYIETVATVGYRLVCLVEVFEDALGSLETPDKPNSPVENEQGTDRERKAGQENVEKGQRLRSWLLPSAAALIVCLALAVWYMHRPLPPPRIGEYVQITHDGQPKVLVGTDGIRLYLNQIEPPSVAQIAIEGGPIATIPVPLKNPFVQDISPDGSTLLVSSIDDRNLWSFQILGGSHRRLVELRIPSAAWSPDGKFVAYSTMSGEIYRIRTDGSEPQKLTAAEGTLPEPASELAWSPDGETLRFTKHHQLWETSTKRESVPRELFPASNALALVCCGHWTPDGAFFIFLSGDTLMKSALAHPGAQLWALDERRGLLRRPPAEPVQLTRGPTRWGSPIPAKDGKKIFARGVTIRGELDRFDAQSKRFQPFLGGISAEFVSFSSDGESVAYVSFPEGILWRAHRDGSNPVKLTNPPLYPKLPRWSPDGTQILFLDTPPTGNPEMYVISSEGGTPKRLLSQEKEPVTDPNWSPDGRKIVFSSCDCIEARDASRSVISVFDLTSHQVTTIPGSKGLWSPRWSPDGRFIVTLSLVGLKDTRVYDLESKRWSVLSTGRIDWPTWSRDSRSIYFLRSLDNPGVYRISLAGGREERVAEIDGFQLTGWFGVWLGLDPTDAPLLLRNVGSEDVYALTLEAK